MTEVMVRLHTRESMSSSSQLLQSDTQEEEQSYFQFHPTWPPSVWVSMPLNQDIHWMGSKSETNCDSFICVVESPCLKNRTHREATTEPFLLASIIFIWLGIFQTSSMAASNQDSLMRDDKQLIDVLINENLVPYFYCNMSCFVISEKAGI